MRLIYTQSASRIFQVAPQGLPVLSSPPYLEVSHRCVICCSVAGGSLVVEHLRNTTDMAQVQRMHATLPSSSQRLFLASSSVLWTLFTRASGTIAQAPIDSLYEQV